MAPITQQVWRYVLAVTSDNMPVAIAMPTAAQILAAKMETASDGSKEICIYVQVNPVGDTEQRYFVTVLNDESMLPSPGLYIDTVLIGGAAVHIYEVTQSVQ